LATINVPANGYAWHVLPPTLNTMWARIVAQQSATGVTAFFHLANPPQEPAPELFAGIAEAHISDGLSDGIIRPQSGDARTLQFAATLVTANGTATAAYYEIDGSMQLRRATNASADNTLRTHFSLSKADFTADAASVLYTSGRDRFRLPKSSAVYDNAFASGWPRGVREVVTERQLFQAHGTFYELPLGSAGGFRRIRPITTHHKHISDFAADNTWCEYARFTVQPGQTLQHRFPDGYSAHWVRLKADMTTSATATFTYGPCSFEL
jgi:hypothetical protein